MTSVVICDDQIIFIKALKYFFKLQSNIEVLGEARNGLEALKLLEDTKPQVCIIDLSMPLMDGVSLIQRLNEEKSPVKKIVLSQNSNQSWLERLITNEIDAFILKSDPKEHLLNAVELVATGEKYFSPAVATIFYKLLTSGTRFTSLSTIEVSLSQREKDVAIHTSKGLTVKEIADKLGCSLNTIKTHKANLMRKIEAKNSAEVTVWVFNHLKLPH